MPKFFVLACILLSACAKHVPIDTQVAYRITRARDGAVLVVQYTGTRTLDELQEEFCREGACWLEVVKLTKKEAITPREKQ
jgi:hypothetical protein